jgi:hypothetical protein
MKRRSVLVASFASFLLAACSGSWGVKYSGAPDKLEARNWKLSSVKVVVPDSLTVSEENTFAPNADIVWHGEEFGDRKAQVRAIMKEGLSKGARGLKGNRPVVFSVRVIRFHGVTPIAVYRAPGAVHNIKFALQVLDARNGQPLTDAELISADLEAKVGTAAVVAAIEGNTQRVRIVRHLAAVTEGWLGLGPDQRRTFEGFGR